MSSLFSEALLLRECFGLENSLTEQLIMWWLFEASQ